MSQDIKRNNSVGGRIMGIDFGSKRIGISISDPTLTIAQGLFVLENNSGIFDEIKKVCAQYDVNLIVVGLPLSLSGNYSSKTAEVLKFIDELKSRLGIKVVKWDERLTTKIAQKSKIDMNLKRKKRQNKNLDDIISSTLILQSYLDFLKNKEKVIEQDEV
ncbi:putative holliday junction resolvase [Candidatus Kryptonium thompsonii]|nr:Holliday junction resolvase RuvX [Candidatus Kryptonium thompsoni]CUS77452.1 putative holliday junction resolvase [Candidatus Kryptonium thompsoni]CUS79758.1 putative holliday junction resolvase [Candidatus Kryptonium thompsoni]CUS83475.1 putative holliday junction resolvase [Candidatus Kryptonium thompsoni]CUS86611.1 putative holliday junction resolvase [Candidatus Kryptonium thompsoni]